MTMTGLLRAESRDQVNRLVDSGKQMTGYHSIMYWNGVRAHRHLSAVPPYAVGTTMCYRKSFWNTYPFPAWSYVEDNTLVYRARDENQSISADARQMMVVRSHSSRTSSATKLGKNKWPEVLMESLPREFFEAIDRYGPESVKSESVKLDKLATV